MFIISKTHGNYSSYMPIMIIYKKKTHGNITLFYYSGYCLYLKPMVNIILKKILEVII